MITDAIVSAFLGALEALLSLLPDTGPVVVSGASTTAVTGWAGAANSWVPVTLIVGVLGMLIAVELALVLWDLIVFVYHQFWGSD